MPGWRAMLALCLLACGCAATGAAAPEERAGAGAGAGEEAAPRPAAAADQWNNLINEYKRSASAAVGAGASAPLGAYTPALPAWPASWLPHPFSLQVTPRDKGESGARLPVPLLVLPVPVPFAAPALPGTRADPAQCQVSGAPPPQLGAATYHTAAQPPPVAAPPPPPIDRTPIVVKNSVPPAPPAPPVPGRSPLRRGDSEERVARFAPRFPPVEDSRVLVEQFRAQQPSDPSQPPVVIEPTGVVSTDDYTLEELQAWGAAPPNTKLSPAPLDQGSASAPTKRVRCRRVRGAAPDAREQAGVPPPPPAPRFERSLYLRARLTVRRADYTEPYTLWWDAATGAARVDFHGGTTSTYRMMKRDGQMQSVMIREERTGESNVRRCVVSTPRRVTLAERALPALPNLQAFSFAGVAAQGDTRVERWRHTVSGHAGELGGARGEALTFRHELLVARAADNYTTTPLRYSVLVDSSVLGPECDSYVHHFDEVRTRHHDPAMFSLDIAEACEHIEVTDFMESVEPLREFTMLHRSPRYDAEIQRYKTIYQRQYLDDVEEAVRKNVLMQSVRHTASGNRQGASFELTTNYLSDRLAVEQNILLGATAPEDGAEDGGEAFPHSRAELDAKRGRLPRNFDWRERGAVTPVRNQGSCSSCWAFATVGAVEGALFVQTGRLVPLSEQVLVDCARPYGANGCKGTWPKYAYNYIKDNGLPALDEYTEYQSKELQCRADSVPPVTRISGHLNVTRDNILALKTAIRKYGPTLVIIDAKATSFISYKKSYYHDARCRKDSPNHAVLAVGWTVHRGETYFIVKNSWTTAWGMEGYIYMRASTNTCGVLKLPSVPRLQRADVLRVPAAAPIAAPL